MSEMTEGGFFLFPKFTAVGKPILKLLLAKELLGNEAKDFSDEQILEIIDSLTILAEQMEYTVSLNPFTNLAKPNIKKP